MQIIEESGKILLKGLMTEADKRNGNGRLYPKNLLKRAVLDLRGRVLDGPVPIYSELEHPPYDHINEANACGIIKEVEWNDTQANARCVVEVLDNTVKGAELVRMIREHKKVGISTRGRGSLNEDQVVTSIRFITADIVKIPSCQNCYLSESTGEMIPNDYIIGVDDLNESSNDPLKDILMIEAFRRYL